MAKITNIRDYEDEYLDQIREAADKKLPLEKLKLDRYLSDEMLEQAREDYDRASKHAGENLLSDIGETMMLAPAIAMKGMEAAAKGPSKMIAEKVWGKVGEYLEDPEDMAKDIQDVGNATVVSSRLVRDPVNFIEERPLETLETVIDVAGPIKLGKFSKIKKPANKGSTKIIGEIEEFDREVTKKNKYDGEGTKGGLKYDQDIEPGEVPNDTDMSMVEQEALDIVDPERLPGGSKWNQSFEKGADEMRPNRDRGYPLDKTFVDEDMDVPFEDMEASRPMRPEDIIDPGEEGYREIDFPNLDKDRLPARKKPQVDKTKKIDKPKNAPWDSDDTLDIGETPNYPDKETMDVENLSSHETDMIIRQMAEEAYPEGGSQKTGGIMAAGKKSNLPDPGLPKGPQGTRAQPTLSQRIKDMLGMNKKPAEIPAEIIDEESGEFLTIEEPKQVRGAKTAAPPVIIDEAVVGEKEAVDRLHRRMGGDQMDPILQKAKEETREIIRMRREAGRAADTSLANEIYRSRVTALRAEAEAQAKLQKQIDADAARRQQAEDQFRAGPKKKFEIPGPGDDDDVMAEVGRLIDEEQAAKDAAAQKEMLGTHARDARRMAEKKEGSYLIEIPDLEALERAGLNPVLSGEQIKPELGAGAFGRVYSVTDADGKIKRAAKVQDIGSASNEWQIRQEIAAAEASDPAVAGVSPKIYDFIEDENGLGTIVMEQMFPLTQAEKEGIVHFLPRSVDRALLHTKDDASYLATLKVMARPDAPKEVRELGHRLHGLWLNHGIQFKDLGMNNIMARRDPKTGKVELVATDVGNFVTKNTPSYLRKWKF